MSNTKTIQVNLGNRSYPIFIGPNLLPSAGQMIAEQFPNCRCCVVSDENVFALHGETLIGSLQAAGISATPIIVEAGEQSKSMQVLDHVISGILQAKLERGDVVIAFGGGVIGDLAGFAAAITRRGMDFVQIPTSLLAQVDSSVGGKTAVNSIHGKNLIGAFYQPKMVISDLTVLKTLSKREFAAGYAEVAKYGLIDKPDFFSWLEKNQTAIFDHQEQLADAVAISCQAKADIVAEDETEHGVRALLNLGHTFAHALETATNYDSSRLVHGEAVSIGMVLAHQFSNRLNLCGIEDAERVERHLSACKLPVRLSDIPGDLPSTEKLLDFIAQDKKVVRGKLTFILTKGIGQSYIANDVAPAEIVSFLNEAKLK